MENGSHDPLKGLDLKCLLNQIEKIPIGAIQREYNKREQNVDK